jgi:hypothetical protein
MTPINTMQGRVKAQLRCFRSRGVRSVPPRPLGCGPYQFAGLMVHSFVVQSAAGLGHGHQLYERRSCAARNSDDGLQPINCWLACKHSHLFYVHMYL